jgi:hypothetical protein
MNLTPPRASFVARTRDCEGTSVVLALRASGRQAGPAGNDGNSTNIVITVARGRFMRLLPAVNKGTRAILFGTLLA